MNYIYLCFTCRKKSKVIPSFHDGVAEYGFCPHCFAGKTRGEIASALGLIAMAKAINAP